jgi:hypothetical protein
MKKFSHVVLFGVLALFSLPAFAAHKEIKAAGFNPPAPIVVARTGEVKLVGFGWQIAPHERQTPSIHVGLFDNHTTPEIPFWQRSGVSVKTCVFKAENSMECSPALVMRGNDIL